MLRRLSIAVLAIALPLAAADAAKTKQAHEPKPPKEKAEETYPAVSHAGEACTADGAFGRKFLRDRNGTTDTTVDEDWAPFTKLSIRYNEITAEADFRGSGDSQDEDEAAAKKFLKAFEKAEHHFAHHTAHTNGSEFHDKEHGESGMSLMIRQDEEHVVARCVSHDR